MVKMNTMLDALKVRAERLKKRKTLTPEEMRERVMNSELVKKIREGKGRLNIDKEA